ncbi:hypothetical protein [Paraburkholderia fungorum]|uniref:hypothetical protein n=1 Tax=Paraburkholderia fungorum TaxID=134537 RepID=UPI00115FED88|nr:hypothetical protein [Paraburkholderia fungorum]
MGIRWFSPSRSKAVTGAIDQRGSCCRSDHDEAIHLIRHRRASLAFFQIDSEIAEKLTFQIFVAARLVVATPNTPRRFLKPLDTVHFSPLTKSSRRRK